MPSSTMRDEDEFKLPADTLLPAKLLSVEEKDIEYTIKKGPRQGEKDTFSKWTWEFEITEGDYAGLRAWGDTEDRLTNHPDNKVRQYAETLLGIEFEVGQGFDTDDVLGLPCVITVENRVHEKQNGEKSYLCPVQDVFPADAMDGVNGEPPF